MSIIESLLLNTSDTTNKTASKTSKGNFLLELLNGENESPDKTADILKSLNIDEKDLDKLLQKNGDAELKESLEKIKELLKNNHAKLQTDTQKSKKEPESSKESLLLELISKPVSNDKLNEEVEKITSKKEIKEKKESKTETKEQLQTLLKTFTDAKTSDTNTQTTFETSKETKSISKTETEILEITKKILTSKTTIKNKNLSDKDVQEFKNATSFKELVDIANKKELNISKIVIDYQKEAPSEKTAQIPLPKNKIELKKQNDFKQIKNINSSKQQIKSSDTAVHTHKQTQQKELLSELLQKTNESVNNIQKETADKNEIKHETQQNKPQQNITLQNGIDIKELKQNITKAKQSVKHFSNSLKDAIDNYKPPVSKLSMELNPKELGKVEVTIVHRGDNLQIQINSNNTAVGFLHSQQQELRQNLINMGFTDVNMSFNQNQQQGNKEYRQNQKFNTNNEESDELIIEIPYQYA